MVISAPGEPVDPPYGLAELTIPPGVIAGAGPITKFCGTESPAPEAGTKTATEARPTFATSLAVICTVSPVGLDDRTVRSCPFHETCALDPKFVPVTVSTNAPVPAFTVAGYRLVITGVDVDTAPSG